MGIRAYQTWSPSNVYVSDCGPPSGTEINASEAGAEHYAYHTWANDNPDSDTQGMHAYVRAQVVLNGQTIPVSVDEGHLYRRQVDATTYELMIGPDGARHTVPFQLPVPDLPRGQSMDYDVNVLEKRRERLENF